MENKYLKYSVEELIQDRDFVSWVLHQKSKYNWQGLAVQDAEFEKTIKTARKIIHLLDDTQNHMSEDEIYSLWMNIDRFDDQHSKNSKIIRLKRVFRYAAVVAILMVITGLSTYYLSNQSRSYQFAKLDSGVQPNNSMLILSNGNEIDLKKDHSTVALDNDGIKINNDSIIDLRKVNSKKLSNEKLNEVIVPFGKRSELILEDGTKVWLNAGSRFAFPTKFEQTERIVYLQGEAYFEVSHSEQRAFFVNANELEVKVLGTRFNVAAYSSEAQIETVLLEGKVSISEIGSLGFLKKEILLKPNQRATYNRTEKTTMVVNEPNADVLISWVNGWFSFSQQSLVDVLQKLERYYNVKFSFDAGFHSDELITGKLDMKDSLNEVLAFLSDLAKTEFRIQNNVVFVEKRIEKLPMRK